MIRGLRFGWLCKAGTSFGLGVAIDKSIAVVALGLWYVQFRFKKKRKARRGDAEKSA